jgi:hypothetical protein
MTEMKGKRTSETKTRTSIRNTEVKEILNAMILQCLPSTSTICGLKMKHTKKKYKKWSYRIYWGLMGVPVTS